MAHLQPHPVHSIDDVRAFFDGLADAYRECHGSADRLLRYRLALARRLLAPAIGGVTMYGDSPEQAAELVSAMTYLLTDKTGERTKTAVGSLAGQLRGFKPKRRADRELYSGAGTTTERLALLQQNPALADEFLKDMTAEAANRVQIENNLPTR